MKIVLFGATDITKTIAEFLHENGCNLAAIITTDENFKISYNKKGVHNSRHVNMYEWGKEHDVAVYAYENNASLADLLSKINPDFGIVAGWYHMVPGTIRDLFSVGCAGFHASLLPALRGGAPLNWALLLGKERTGVSFFELSDGVDDGALMDQEEILIEANDYIGDLVKKSDAAILAMLKRTMPEIIGGAYNKTSQVGIPSYCAQRCPEDSLIKWNNSPQEIVRLIKASSHPYAGAYSYIDGQKVIIWRASLSSVKIHGAPGQIFVLGGMAHIICGSGALCVEEYTSSIDLLKCNQQRLNESDA